MPLPTSNPTGLKREQIIRDRLKVVINEALSKNGGSGQIGDESNELLEAFSKGLGLTYDSKFDPQVIADIPFALGSDLANGLIAIPAGSSYTFVHNLGFIPQVTVIRSPGGFWWGITNLTETQCTIYSDHPNTLTGTYRIICN